MQWWRTTDHRLGSGQAQATADCLRAGGVVAVPTETYYGLAAHWQRPAALRKVRALKGRDADKPLLLLVSGVGMARRLCPQAPAALERLSQAFWPGPLTLVLPGPAKLNELLAGPSGTLAVRHSPHPALAEILGHLGEPVTGTSANRSGEEPAVTVDAIRLSTDAVLDGVVDDGEAPGGSPSTLLQLSEHGARLLRAGAVEATAIRRLIGDLLL